MRLIKLRLLFICVPVWSVMAQSRSPHTTLSAIAQENQVLSVASWDVGDKELLWVVTEGEHQTEKGQHLPARIIALYEKEKDDLNKVFQQDTPDGFIAAYSLSESGGRFFSAWSGGSAYHFKVFAYIGGKVEQVLDATSRGFPEIVIGADEQESILVTHEQLVEGAWSRTRNSTTELFKWNGTSYSKGRSIPWGRRFQPFTR